MVSAVTQRDVSLRHERMIITLGGNGFEGKIKIDNLSSRLQSLRLNDTHLSGTIDVKKLPASLSKLNIQNSSLLLLHEK